MRREAFLVMIFGIFLSIESIAQPAAKVVEISGLKERVTVWRDSRSIPYIEAQNEADLYFVQGYVTASDRLWQMDLLRRVARGETAEIFGKTTLEEDKRWRRFGFADVVEKSLRLYSPEMKSVLESYASGVNAYIASLDEASIPVEFKLLQYKPRPWTPADTLMIGKILADGLSTSYPGDLTRESLLGFDRQKLADLSNSVTPYDVVLFGSDAPHAAKTAVPKIDGTRSIDRLFDGSTVAAVSQDLEIRKRSLQRIGFYSEELAASNNWVISGKRT